MSQRRVQGRYAPATSEAARRQLMQPVTVWEKTWVPIESAGGPGTSLKVLKWVKTEKIPQFNDDDGETLDAPLAPLPDDAEMMLVGDDDEGDEAATGTGTSRAESERLPETPARGGTAAESSARQRHPLSMSFLPGDGGGSGGEDLGMIADHHLQEDAAVFETQSLEPIDVGEGILQDGMLVEDVVPLNVGQD